MRSRKGMSQYLIKVLIALAVLVVGFVVYKMLAPILSGVADKIKIAIFSLVPIFPWGKKALTKTQLVVFILGIMLFLIVLSSIVMDIPGLVKRALDSVTGFM